MPSPESRPYPVDFSVILFTCQKRSQKSKVVDVQGSCQRTHGALKNKRWRLGISLVSVSKNQARLSFIVCTKGVVNPRTITFQDQATGFYFLVPYFFIMLKAMDLNSLGVPPQNETIYTIFCYTIKSYDVLVCVLV